MSWLEEQHRILEEVEDDTLSDESLRKIKDSFHTGLFDGCEGVQLKPFGASNFLVHQNKLKPMVIAEFRSGSGNMFDRWYACNALRTWHQLAHEVLNLREEVARLREKVESDGG